MKRILLPFLLLATSVSAHPEQLWVIHPQANVQYPCPYGTPINMCIQTACNMATPYGCRVMSNNYNTYYIETYVPPTYYPPVVVIPPPVVTVVPPYIFIPPIFSMIQNNQPPQHRHDYRHRPSRR